MLLPCIDGPFILNKREERMKSSKGKDARNQGRPCIWQDNIKKCTRLLLVEAVRATEICSQLSKIVHDAAKPCTAEED